jgi:hypothetical protein
MDKAAVKATFQKPKVTKKGNEKLAEEAIAKNQGRKQRTYLQRRMRGLYKRKGRQVKYF